MSNWFIWTDFTVLLHDNMKYSNTLTIFIRISNIIAPSYDFFNELQKNQIIFGIAYYAILDAFHKKVINQGILREKKHKHNFKEIVFKINHNMIHIIQICKGLQ